MPLILIKSVEAVHYSVSSNVCYYKLVVLQPNVNTKHIEYIVHKNKADTKFVLYEEPLLTSCMPVIFSTHCVPLV